MEIKSTEKGGREWGERESPLFSLPSLACMKRDICSKDEGEEREKGRGKQGSAGMPI